MLTTEIDKLFMDFYILNEKATRLIQEAQVKYVENLGIVLDTEAIGEIIRLAQMFLKNIRDNYGTEVNDLADKLISGWKVFKEN